MIRPPTKLLLTFDDGPHPIWTRRIVDLLDSSNVKGIFFCVGSQVERFPEITKAIIDRGHLIGNHMWSHNPFRSLVNSKLENEIARVHDHFVQNYNYQIRVYRPPWGILLSKARSFIESKWGYKIIHWDVDCHDYIWPYPRHLSFPSNTTNKPVQILLMHDGAMFSPISSKTHTIDALKYLIQHQNQDYIFMHPEEILSNPDQK
jgi:peptidoglycan-N-acetylglucosamine deacetylase